MRSISAGIAACVVAAVAVGCGPARAPHSGSAARTAAPAGAGNPARKSGVPTAGPAGAGAPSGCQRPAPAGPTGKTLTITLAGNEKTYCVRVGDTLHVYLRGTGSGRWLPPLASRNALVPIQGTHTRVTGATGASFAAVRPGQVLMTSVRPPCQITVPPGKGDLEPGFPLRKTYPLRFCAPGHRFSVSIIVLR